MSYTISTVFTKQAEELLIGETGLHAFTWSVYPNVGDSVTIKTSPSKSILTFVCTNRHFDFSSTEQPVLTITLGLP
jgi:hypothetical protein